jgi:GxxExxY protein
MVLSGNARVNLGRPFALRVGVGLVSNDAADAVIGCAIRVHQHLGPGLYESVYQACLALEMNRLCLQYQEQVAVGISYDGVQLPGAFRVDFIVQGEVVVEIKSVEQVLPLHHRQVLTYMRLSGIQKGLLVNFNVSLLKQGLRSFVL